MIRTNNLGCPICYQQGLEVPLQNQDFGTGVNCANGHRWNDTAELMALKPPLLKGMKIPSVPKPPSTNSVNINVLVPTTVQQALKARFGDAMSETLGTVVACILDEGSFFVSAVDSSRLTEATGQKIRSGQELYGIVYSLKKDCENYKGQLDAKTPVGVVAPGGANGNAVTFRNKALLERLMKKAIDRGETLPTMIEGAMEYVLSKDLL